MTDPASSTSTPSSNVSSKTARKKVSEMSQQEFDEECRNLRESLRTLWRNNHE
jgi:hypothetical protein